MTTTSLSLNVFLFLCAGIDELHWFYCQMVIDGAWKGVSGNEQCDAAGIFSLVCYVIEYSPLLSSPLLYSPSCVIEKQILDYT